MDPDVSCQYTGTEVSSDTDSVVQPGATTPSGRVPARHAADPSSCPIKETDADARAVTVNPAKEHVGKAKTKYLRRRRHKEEDKQMETFRAAACVMNENNTSETEQKGVKYDFVRRPVSTGR